jgi:hypothetical protein
MKSIHKIVIACICLEAACAAFADTQKTSANQEAATLQNQPMVETESGSQETMVEQSDDWLEAHESNGPEGMRGVPMQRMSLFQSGLVMAILVAGGGLATLARKTNPSDKPSSP